jgi:PAS domain S-box-containing protein
MIGITNTYHPIIILIAIGLTIAASYTALDMFTFVKTSDSNKTILFLGGTISLGIGIWIMNFIGLIAIDVNRFRQYQIPMTILSIFIGIAFTGMAFFTLIGKTVKNYQLFFASFLLTLAVISVHIISTFAMNLNFNYNVALLLVSAILIFGSFLFSLWVLFSSKGFAQGNQVWRKPISAIIVTAAIVEGHFILNRAVQLALSNNNGKEQGSVSSFIIYLVLFVSILIFVGLIGSSAIISEKLEVSDTNLSHSIKETQDINFALDQSSIVAITDQKGIITSVNDKFCEISKYSREELIGQDHRILNSGFHSREFFQNLWSTIGNGKVWKGEICNRSKDGTLYWVDTTIVPFLNANEKPYQYVAIRTDISDRKRAEDHLKETLKENLDIKFALDQSSIVAFTDARGIITSTNDKFCEISKYNREELIGKSHGILNSGYHSREFFQNLWKTILTGHVWKGEICNKAKDGSFYWVDTTIVPFIDEKGKPYQFLAIRNDITERKRTEEILHQQDKLAAVGQLAAGVAHEIRNPLTSMKGYTEFLQLDEKDPERLEFLSIILDEIERVNMIVEDFMVLAKPKAVELEEKNVIPVIKNVVSLLEFEARKRHVRLHLECEAEIIQIECDENRLKQVFLNFIKNGIEAMPNGGDLYVRTFIKDNNVQISIQDTGVGIPEDKLKKLGEPFFTTKKNGNGLGLMVSFKIIESHNGKVFIESEQNKGTTFNIFLPARTA